jgi:hypothetical protein
VVHRSRRECDAEEVVARGATSCAVRRRVTDRSPQGLRQQRSPLGRISRDLLLIAFGGGTESPAGGQISGWDRDGWSNRVRVLWYLSGAMTGKVHCLFLIGQRSGKIPKSCVSQSQMRVTGTSHIATRSHPTRVRCSSIRARIVAGCWAGGRPIGVLTWWTSTPALALCGLLPARGCALYRRTEP